MENICSSSSNPEQHNQKVNFVDDDWLEDGSDLLELNQESEAREKEFRVLGYRDGIIAGKESSAQEGFNVGFKKAVLRGLKWGFLRGVTSALVGLSDPIKVKLVENGVDKDKLWELCEAVRFTSNDNVLRNVIDDKVTGKEGFNQIEQQYDELKSILSNLGDFKVPERD